MQCISEMLSPPTILLRGAITLLLVVALPLMVSAQQGTPAPLGGGCAQIMLDIDQLQQDLANLSAEMQSLTNDLNTVNQDVSRIQGDLQTATTAGKAAGGGSGVEALRGQILDSLAKAMAVRRNLEQQITDDSLTMQAIKDEIADLLNKLANCAPPGTKEPQQGKTGAQPQSVSPVPPNAPPAQPPIPQPGGQECGKIKQDIEQLQQDLANLSAEMQSLTTDLNTVNQDVSRIQGDLQTATTAGKAAGGGSGVEALRGQILDSLAKAMAVRKNLEQQIADDSLTMQAIKDEIADLLNKLANCAPPNATQPPKQETPTEQPPTPPSRPSPSKSQTSMGTTGAGIQFQLRGFGGASFVNGNTPATSGFDGAVLFPLGNHVLIGPTAGFQWINSAIVNSIGSQQPGSTFIHTSTDFKQGNFGGSVGFPFGGFQLGIQGGATVANSTITQQSGFCGLGNATSPAGCTIFSSTTTHDTVTAPFVGGYIQHSIFSHVGVFVGYDYHFGLKDTKPNATNPTGPPVTVLNLHYSDAVAGFNFTFGRH